jgi:hypothetical protein
LEQYSRHAQRATKNTPTAETIPVEYITVLIHGLNVNKIQTHKIIKDRNNQTDSIKEGASIKAALTLLVEVITMGASEANNKISTRHSLAHSFKAYSQIRTQRIKSLSIKTQTTIPAQPAGCRVARVLALGTTDRTIAKTARLIIHPVVRQGSETKCL